MIYVFTVRALKTQPGEERRLIDRINRMPGEDGSS